MRKLMEHGVSDRRPYLAPAAAGPRDRPTEDRDLIWENAPGMVRPFQERHAFIEPQKVLARPSPSFLFLTGRRFRQNYDIDVLDLALELSGETLHRVPDQPLEFPRRQRSFFHFTQCFPVQCYSDLPLPTGHRPVYTFP